MEASDWKSDDAFSEPGTTPFPLGDIEITGLGLGTGPGVFICKIHEKHTQ